jgi:hypothetical protein
MNINATSYVADVVTRLQQLSEIRLQQIEVDIEVAESIRRVRQQAVDQSFQDLSKQAERINEIKKAELQTRSGSIDVWA